MHSLLTSRIRRFSHPFPLSFIVAGHETTSGATMWCLFALSKAQDVQHKLREELLTIGTDTPTMDELNALPYLDMVVRETLRIHSPVPMSHRVAQKDDLLPLEKPFTDRYGEVHDNIRSVYSLFMSLIYP